MAGVEGLRMIVKAGSMTRADGSIPSPTDPATLSLNQVHHDNVPMPMPDGVAPPFAWTLQPGGAHFDPPIEIFYPNMTGLAPGQIAYFLSFDHDTGQFEIVASGSVTDDGNEIVSDPGAGLSVAGWGCNCPPYSVTGKCRNCFDIAVIFFRGGPEQAVVPGWDDEFSEYFETLERNIRRIDPSRIVTTIIESSNSLQQQIDQANAFIDNLTDFGSCPRPRVILVVHSLGGDTVRLSVEIRAQFRFTIDPITRAETIDRLLAGSTDLELYQRDLHFDGEEEIINFLAEDLPLTDAAPDCRSNDFATASLDCLRGYHIDNAMEELAVPRSNHSNIIEHPLVEARIAAKISEFLPPGPNNKGAQYLFDESFVISAGGQTVPVSSGGSFVIPNIAAPDQFGRGGPGTIADFIADDVLRIVGIGVIDGETVYASSNTVHDGSSHPGDRCRGLRQRWSSGHRHCE